MGMYPHERSLVTQYEGKPFALLGVNTDEDPEVVKRLLKEGTVTWRSWRDGGEGRISRAWEVQSFPTIYILDHKGVIRYKGPDGANMKDALKNLDNMLEKLIREAENDKTS